MNKLQAVLFTIIYLFFIYLAVILSSIIERFANAKDKMAFLSNPQQVFLKPATDPIGTFTTLFQTQSKVFFILLGIATLLMLYVIFKTLLGKKDGNDKNQGYKIAKHGSHGSARFATVKELLSGGYYKSINSNNINSMVLKTLDENLLKEKGRD